MMRSKLRSAFNAVLVASIVLGLSTTPANAEPVTTAILAAINYIYLSFAAVDAAALTWADVAIFALKTAAIIGLSYAVNSIFAPTYTPGKPSGVKTTIRLGGDLPRSFITGYTATAGSLVYGATWGSIANVDNAYLTQVIALSDLPTTALMEIWVGSNKVTWTVGLAPTAPWGTPIIEYRDPTSHEDYLWVRFYDGTQTTNDAFLLSQFGSDPKFPWTSNMIGTGVSYVIVTSRFNSKFYSGVPTFKWAVQGAAFYDPRLDSTVGGSGTHLWSVPSTWAYTDNPMVINYNIFRGISYGGVNMWGPQGVTANRVPLAAWFAAMNACDVTTTDAAAATVRTYRCGLEITVDSQPVDVIETLNQACNARIAEVGGVYKPLVGAAGSSIMSFTDDNIVIDATQQFDMFPSQAMMINGAAAVYPEPIEAWANKDAPLRINATYEAADGKRLLANLNYVAVPYSSQVQQLMDSAIDESRKFKKHTIVLGPQAWALEPLDTITWTSARNSYTSKLFRVLSVMDTYSLDIVLVIAEVDPADYTFNTSTDYLSHTPISQGLTFGLPKPPDLALTLLQSMLAQQEADAEAFIQNITQQVNTSQQFGKANAWSINSLQTTVVDGLTAMAIAVQEFGASNANASALIVLETAARVAADTAETLIRSTQVATLTTSVNTVAASVVSQTGTLVAPGSATALDVTTLTTTVNGHTTTISSHTGSINGISAQWGVTITTGNRITGAVRLDSGATNSNFVVVADNFYIFPTGGSDTAMFSVSAGVAYFAVPLVANLIVAANILAGNITLVKMATDSVDTAQLLNLAVQTGKINTHAATLSTNGVLAGPTSAAAASAFTALSTVTDTFAAAPSLIWISADMSIGAAGNQVYGVRVLYDGVSIYSVSNVFSILNNSHTPFSLLIPHTPGSGSHTYDFQFNSSSTACQATNAVIAVFESRR